MQYLNRFSSQSASKQEWPRALNILIVDDQLDTAELLQSLFQFEGHAASIAHTAEGALRAAAAHRFDAVYVDIKHARMAWPGLASVLRQLPGFKETPLVAISAIDRYADPLLDLSAFDHVIVKPAGLVDIMLPLRILVLGRALG